MLSHWAVSNLFIECFDRVFYTQVLATFCTTIQPGGAKSTQTYKSPELLISIPLYFPTCYSKNLYLISFRPKFVLISYTGFLFLPQWILRESSITVLYIHYRIDLNITFYDFLQSQKCLILSPPFPLILIKISKNPPEGTLASSVRFPGPTPYLKCSLAP